MPAVRFSAAELPLSLLLVLILSAGVHGATNHGGSRAAPAPSVDCSTLILDMADCLSFVSSGRSVSKPEGSCCSGLKTVLKTNAECICEVFKTSASLGVTLNVTKALTLPAACKLHAPSVANCDLSVPPAGAPGMSPATAAGEPAESAGSNSQAPSPAPGNSASSLFPVSMASLVSAILVLLFSRF